PPQSQLLRLAVQEGHRTAAAPVRHRSARRAGQAADGNRKRLLPGGGRRARRLLGPEPVLPSLQAPDRRHAGTIPDARKNRQNGVSSAKKSPLCPPYHSL